MDNRQKRISAVIILFIFAVLLLIWYFNRPQPVIVELVDPIFETQVIAEELSNPWDIGFLPDGRLIILERSGKASIIDGDTIKPAGQINDTYANGEGGALGLAIDPNFEKNTHIYTCSNINRNGTVDIRVTRWELVDDILSRSDGFIRDIPSNTSGRHSGCQLEFGPDGYLYIGTGDAANGTNPQDPRSLGGKILRVDLRAKAVSGNLEDPFDSRIYSYGHRNVQGITFLKESTADNIIGFSTEHGPDIDDEINLIKIGNFGWDPVPNYNESVPMTDKQKFPDAIEAVWSSGNPTLAISGITQINGSRWGLWDGAIGVAALKGQRVMIFKFENSSLEQIGTILTDIGRIRTIQAGPDENLYVLTDNGDGKDKVLKLIPQDTKN